jgi:ABC-type nitrate/sulfonate/bicarbonate transport system substrate-binding protein
MLNNFAAGRIKSMIQRIVSASLLLCFLLVLPTAGQSKDINIGWSGIGSWTTLPYVVANEKGFFDREGLKVQLITFRGTNLMLTALLAGELDYATILPFLTGAAARGLPVRILGAVTKSSSYVMISRPEIDSVKALRGKRLGINSFGSSADYAAYAAVSRSGMDPNKDVTILPIGGGTADRMAALVSGTVDATVVTSPAEYQAEKQGLRVLMSASELGALVRIPITGVGATLKKIEKDGDEIVRVLRALRLSTLYLLQNPEYTHGLYQKIMRVEPALAERLFKLYRDQYNPELSLSEAIVDDLLAVGTFRLKEKPKAALNQQGVRDWSFAEKAKR